MISNETFCIQQQLTVGIHKITRQVYTGSLTVLQNFSIKNQLTYFTRLKPKPLYITLHLLQNHKTMNPNTQYYNHVSIHRYFSLKFNIHELCHLQLNSYCITSDRGMSMFTSYTCGLRLNYGFMLNVTEIQLLVYV